VDLIAVLLAVGATLIWGIMLLTMKLGVDEMSWVGFGFLRPWMGLPFIALYAWITNGFVFESPTLVLVALGGGVLNAFLGTGLFYYALAHGSMHESNILANTGPFWGVVSAILVLGEPAKPVTFTAGMLVVAGAYFLIRRSKGDTRTHNVPALLAAVGAGILWGFSAAVPTKFCMNGGMSPIAYELLFAGGASVAWTLAAWPALRRGRMKFTRKGLWIAFISSFLGLFVGWVLWLSAIQRVHASALAPMNGLTPLFAVLLGVIFLREPINRRILVGGTLTVAGVTLVSVLVR